MQFLLRLRCLEHFFPLRLDSVAVSWVRRTFSAFSSRFLAMCCAQKYVDGLNHQTRRSSGRGRNGNEGEIACTSQVLGNRITKALLH